MVEFDLATLKRLRALADTTEVSAVAMTLPELDTILAALTELEELRAEVARLLVLGEPGGPEIIARRTPEEWAYLADYRRITTILTAREAEEASGS